MRRTGKDGGIACVPCGSRAYVDLGCARAFNLVQGREEAAAEG